jgi:glycosyltransferase involved in cell wall biosynthesis
VVVVPCFNEEPRLDEQAFLDLVETGGVRLVFVNDGSTDGTGLVLERLGQMSADIEVLELSRNGGKAEAVRRGLLYAIAEGALVVGYLDADLATPGSELLRMVRILEARADLAVVFGSRVARLGSHIERSPFRHYTGRVFATIASWALDAAVYDTQCGAKVFRVNENLIAAVDRPFQSAWSFDVFLCQRLLDGTPGLPGLPISSFLELPLDAWTDIAGSKVDVRSSVAAAWDVFVMGVERRRRRRSIERPGPASPEQTSAK